MARNRLDFVRPGTVAGQVAEVWHVGGYDHGKIRDGRGANGQLEPITYTVPGVDMAITLSGHPFVYRVGAVAAPDGPQVVELHIGSPERDVPNTPDDLRRLARYLARLAYVATNPAEVIALLDSERFHEPERPLPKRPGRKGHPDTHYAEIATYAKQAHRDRDKTGVSVRAAIAARYSVTRDQANKWLRRARDLGYLEAGELGGQPKPRKRPSAN